jgi:pimeloyl-ACP methyl ester carboxylesterase
MRTRLTASVIVLALLASTPLLRAQQAAVGTAPATLAAAADQQFTGDGVTLRYRDVGTGDPIVFIHGYTGALESMFAVANALPADHRKVALDVRGFGKSSKFSDAAKFGQNMVDDVIHLMDSLKIQRGHLVGHSMGALIAANVLARYPDRVSSAALVAGPFWDEPQFTAESKRWMGELENGAGLTRFMAWLLPALNEQQAAGFAGAAMKTNHLGSLIESMRAMPTLKLTALPKGGDKALIVAGTGDPLFPTSVALARNSPGSKIVDVQGANHVAVITHAETVKAIAAQLGQ